MTAATVTLTDFLLARISEDHADTMSGWRWESLPAGEYYRLQARVLAECEAKRRIVELHGGGSHECSTFDHNGEVDTCTWVIEGDECSTMHLLALPYADHPDYRNEWRP